MSESHSIIIQNAGASWQLLIQNQPLLTPRKRPFSVPSQALMEAIAQEWQATCRFSTRVMPLTAMAYAAIDVVPEHFGRVVEALLAYMETDLLLYRSETHELKRRQASGWDPLVAWAAERYGCTFKATEGVMPMTQPRETIAVLQSVVQAMDAFTLSAFSTLTQSLGSLALALAVRERRISGEEAFRLSRIDEDFQAERWGEDSVTLARAQEILRDVQAAERFMGYMGGMKNALG